MPSYTDAELAADVELHQWVVLKIAPDREAEYAYSVGLTRSFSHPELVVVGLDDESMQELINDIGDAIEAGRGFADGDVSSDFLEGYDVAFRAVPARLYAARFAWAERFYAGASFSVLQVVYPDAERKWPWDAGVDRDLKRGQPLLADLPAPPADR
jgi:hypothetical protein